MKLAQVRSRVEKIRKLVADEGSSSDAHPLEDSLYIAVLGAIARGEAADPASLAAAALEANDIEYERWYS